MNKPYYMAPIKAGDIKLFDKQVNTLIGIYILTLS